ncbi:MAG: XisI protein [Bacteroidota bacterium]
MLTCSEAQLILRRTRKETMLIFDDERGHYQVTRIGWDGIHGIFMVIFHFDVKDGKIWVQRNISDYDIVGDIEEKGVPKSEIVLAFHSPRMRPYTGYAAA